MPFSSSIWPPLVVAELLVFGLFDGMSETMSQVLSMAAIGSLVAGFFAVARYRAALDASDKSGKAWHDEAEAAIARCARVENDNAELRSRLAAAEARTDLTKHEERAAERNRVLIAEMKAAFSDVHDNQSVMARTLALISERLGGK